MKPFPPSEKPFRFGKLEVMRDWPWVEKTLHCHLVEDTTGIVAIDAEGDYAGVVVMDGWTPSSVFVHIAVLNPMVLRHGFLSKAADAIFSHAGRELVLGMVPSNNEKALAFNKKIGFTELFRIKNGFDYGVDYVILEMRRDDCRWLTEDTHHGKEVA